MATLGLMVLIAAPIVVVETACRPEGGYASPSTPLVADEGYRREEARSYLSYPEWYIVHAYEDFAGVLRIGTESDFAYLASIRGFWTSLCGASRVAARSGGGDLEIKAMLYTIGLSFTAEMAIKGAYEKTLGQVTAWLRGAEPTKEDRFARRLSEDYARFLQQTPWYEYPFAAELGRFWRETPLAGPHLVRKIERRIALSVEYATKAGYAALLGAAAGLAPADLKIRSVIEGLDDADLAAIHGIQLIRELPGGRALIETPRYREYTEILRNLSKRGRSVVEIAGNDDILATVLVPEHSRFEPPDGARIIFEIPIQSRPGWRRMGLDVKVPALSKLFDDAERQGAWLEHVYDY